MPGPERPQLYPGAWKYVPALVATLDRPAVCDPPVSEIPVKHEHDLMAWLAIVSEPVLKHAQEAQVINRLTDLLGDFSADRRFGSLAEFDFPSERTVEHFTGCRIGCPEHKNLIAAPENTQRLRPD